MTCCDLRVNEYTAFCNGPGDVKSPRVIVTPPSSRFCPWSAPRPPHYAVRRNGEPIYMRGSSDDGHWPCNGFTSSTVPATGLRAVGASVRPACVSYSSLINPAMPSASLRPSGKLCRQSTCGAGLLRSCEPRRPSPALNSPLGDVHAPAFEFREPRYPRQQNIGSFIECRAHHLIPGSRDSAGDIFFTRLILLRCQPEQRSYRLRLPDPARIVHRRLEGNCHQRTNARHCHQPSADRVFTNNREHSLVQFLVLRLQSCARRKHRLSNALQRGMTCHQFPNPRFKRLAGHLADLQAETTQDSPNAQFHVQQPSEKLLARNQQRPDLLRSNRFGVHLPEPSHPQQLCKPTRILAVRLHRHRRQCRLHMPRLQQNGLKSCLRQPGMQPL